MMRETACEALRVAVWWWLCVDVSLSGNGLSAKGGSAIAGALPRLTSLTTLEYVRSEGVV
jgi:hypothetical protein